MKKLLFLSMPLIMAGVVALGARTADANFADYEDTPHIATAAKNEKAAGIGAFGIGKEFLREIDPLLLEDPNLQKDFENAQDI